MSESAPVTLAENAYHNLGSKTFWFFVSERIAAAFGFLIVALGLSMFRSNIAASSPDVAGFVRTGSWIAFAIALGALAFAFVASKLVYKNTSFALTPDALKIRRGVFSKEEFAIPYRQIQNIEIERSIAQRMLGISRFIILTAGHETVEEERADAPEGILPAIDKNVALSLQDELLRRANIQKTVEMK